MPLDGQMTNRPSRAAAPLRLLGIFAHPDDEESMGAAFVRYHRSGVETGLICATRGEVGEIADPSLATPETLGAVREGEMRAAAAALEVDHLWLLTYRDSGMAGTPENRDPRALLRADAERVVGDLVRIVRAFRPQVIVTFEPGGAYGHPDHITIHRAAVAAFDAAADPGRYADAGPPFAAAKLYYTGLRRGVVRAMAEWIRSRDPTGPFSGMEPDQLGIPDDRISVTLDARPWRAEKDRAWSMHRTQANSAKFLEEMPDEIRHHWDDEECYQLAKTRVGPDAPGENDLFARVPAEKERSDADRR